MGTTSSFHFFFFLAHNTPLLVNITLKLIMGYHWFQTESYCSFIVDDAHYSCWSDEICSLWRFDVIIITTVCWLYCVFAIGWRKKTWWNTGVSEEQSSSVWRVRGGIRGWEKPSYPTEESTGIWTGGWGWGRRLILRWSSS